MPSSPKGMATAVVRNLEKNTGKTLDQWLKVARKGPKEGKDLVKWLREEQGLGMNTAYAIVAHSDSAPDWMTKPGGTLLDEQYTKGKEELRPIYDTLAAEVARFGEDVVLDPRKTYVTLRRSKQFGTVQPATKTRVDVCVRLPGVKPTKRLADAGGAGSSSITHKVGLTSLKDVDKQLIGWLKKAYEARGA